MASFDFGFDVAALALDEVDDAAIDRWHDGVLDAFRIKTPASSDSDYLEGFAHGLAQRNVRVVMPKRPEGYYHMPLGTFD